SHGVVETRRFGSLLAEAAQSLRTVVKPPGRTQLEHWVMAGQRRQLAAVGRLIQSEHDDGQPRMVTEAIQQRLQRAHVVRRLGNIGSLVPAVGLEERAVVV